jgi:adenylate kinase family enzyme
MVAVIGPPGAGKSTVVSALASVEGTVVFRLREAVRAYADVVGAVASGADPLGWIDLGAVRRVLDEAFVAGRFPTGGGPVLLDNFPGTAAQLDLLIEVAAASGRRVALMELSAGSAVVTARTALRRVCPECGPDVHHPAVAAVGEPHRCAGCGAGLVRRDTDTPARHGLRLARYRDNAAEIVVQARRRQIPHVAIDADPMPVLVRHSAQCAVHWLSQTAMAALVDPAVRSRS